MPVQNIVEYQISVYNGGSVCVIFRRDTAAFKSTEREAGSITVQELICYDKIVNNSNAHYNQINRIEGLKGNSHPCICCHCQLIHSLAKHFLCVFLFFLICDTEM